MISMASEQSKFAGLRNKTDSGAERQPQSRGNSGLSKNRKRMGRPPGKRSNPAYTQVTVHLNKEGYYEAQSRLNREKAAEFYMLVQIPTGDFHQHELTRDRRASAVYRIARFPAPRSENQRHAWEAGKDAARKGLR